MKWYDKFKQGQTSLDELEDLIEQWHIDNTIEEPLHEFLGMSREDYEEQILFGEINKQS